MRRKPHRLTIVAHVETTKTDHYESMTEDLLQIGEFAKRSGTNLRTLRYYEELGLIEPTCRSSGKFRYYREDQLERVAAIKRLQGLGMSLREIGDLLPTGSDDSNVLEAMDTAIQKQTTITLSHLDQLQGNLANLEVARKKLEQCRNCDHTLGGDACDGCTADEPAVRNVFRSLLPARKTGTDA